MKICIQCGRHYKTNKNNRCSTCRARDQRNKNRDAVVTALGGECIICGYKKCRDALDVHHLRDKSFSLCDRYHYALADLLEEAKKCVLLCSNCHREVHASFVSICGSVAKLAETQQT